MKDNSLKINETKLPHQPYFISDENDNVVATIHHNDYIHAIEYARLFKNAPKMEKVLWKMLEYFSKPENVVDVDILNDVANIQIELSQPIETEKPTHWKDEVMEKGKNESLDKIFRDNNKN